MLHTRMTRFLTATVAVVGLTAVSAPAVANNTTFAFTGDCVDCTNTGTGTLVLKDYTFGDALTTANFVSFTYSSNLLDYTLTSVNDLNGSLTDVAGPSFVSFHGAYNFVSTATSPISFWCTGDTGSSCGADWGMTSRWSLAATSAVPEPAMWGAMVLGFGLLGASMRRPRRTGLLAA